MGDSDLKDRRGVLWTLRVALITTTKLFILFLLIHFRV